MQSIHDIEVKEDSLFFRPQEGDNYVRIVSGFKARTIEFETGPTVKFTCLVIDREDGKVKVADFGKMIMKQLKTFASNKEYAFKDTPEYDINIQREGTGMETKYTVIPARANTELTAEEKEAVKAFGSLEEFLSKGDDMKANMEAQGVTKKDKPESEEVSVDDILF